MGTVTSSTSSNYVGTQMIFVVADNATPGINADQWDFDFAGTEESCDTYANRFPIVGGVIDAGPLLLGPAERSYREALQARGRLPVADVRGAEMGNLAGVVGAADLARRR